MGFRPCVTRDDPFTRRVRETYGANVVSAPRAGIEPLDTLAVRKRRVEQRGSLGAMLDDGEVAWPAPQSAPAAALSGVRSAEVDVELGLSLSAKFLAALGVPAPGADVTASLWNGASGFTFEVKDVVEHQVDVAVLGRALQGRHIERTPATAVFFDGDGTELFLITRTLTSQSFAIRGTSRHGQSVKVAVDAVADLLGKASGDVTWSSDGENAVAIAGPTPVTFAFAAIPCAIDAQGAVVFGLTTRGLTFGESDAESSPEARPVVDEPGLLVLDEPEDTDRSSA
jgi:hypothetical protein